MSSLDLFIVNLAFPYIGRQYRGASLSSLSWVLNGYTIVFAAVLVPAGRWADRVGRRRVFVAWPGRLQRRLAALRPGTRSGRADRCPGDPGGRGRPDGAGLAVTPACGRPAPRPDHVPSAPGPPSAPSAPRSGRSSAAGLVQLSWRWVFWINLPVGLVAILLATRVVPESKDERAAGRPDLVGAATARRRRRPGRPGPCRGARLGVGLGQLHRPAGSPRWPAPRPWWPAHGGITPQSSNSGCCGRAYLQRHVRRVDPLLRRLRGLRAQLGRVPDRRVALLRGAGGPRHRARATHGPALRPAGRPAPGRPPRWAWPGGGDRLRRERRRPVALAHPDPGAPGVPDPPAAGPVARRRRGRPDDPLAARRGQRGALAGPIRHRQRNPQHGPPGRHRPGCREPGRGPLARRA